MLYLGRHVDPVTLEPGLSPYTLAPDRLTRHAVCFGMTGSGKTGLCVTVLEELAMAGVPVLVLDPKGDMANLALAFRGHPAEAFEPWVDASEAERKGRTVAEHAEATAAMWRKGLADWGVDAERIGAFAEGAEVSILTPGSTAGIPLDVLSALRRPDDALLADPELAAELVSGVVSALLGLVGVDADPVEDPEHIVLATLLADAWQDGQDPDLPALITGLVDPPFERVGVFSVETFLPRRERMKLAMKLNGLVASPTFATWNQGVALDIDALLAPIDGKTPVRIVYGAHLDDAQRLFLFSTVLARVVAWSRRQSGTSALRALVYFDEVMGFLPPYPKNPATKAPILTLMKQARAVGVGTMLVTQNPVDVDYKALSNAGTWFVGRLQTEQDRERVLDGLVSAGGAIDQGQIADWLAALPSRTFVVRDVKEPEVQLVHSRWAISYLRGPMTRTEIERLDQPWPTADREPVSREPVSREPAPHDLDDDLLPAPPPAPEGVRYRFLHPASVLDARRAPVFADFAEPARSDGLTVWRPALYLALGLVFDEGRSFRDERTVHRLFFPLDDDLPEPVDVRLASRDLLDRPPPNGRFAPLPSWLDSAREIAAATRRAVDDVYRGETVLMYRHRKLRLVSGVGEDEAAFRARVSQEIEARIEHEAAKLKDRVETRVRRLEDKQRKLEQKRAELAAEKNAQLATEALGAAETVFGLFFGGRRRSVSTLARNRRRTSRLAGRIEDVGEDLAHLEEQVLELADETEAELEALAERERATLDDIESTEVRLEKNDMDVRATWLVWVPVTRGV